MPFIPPHPIHIETPVLSLDLVEPHVNNYGNEGVGYYTLHISIEKGDTFFEIPESLYPINGIQATYSNQEDLEQYQIHFRATGRTRRTLKLYDDGYSYQIKFASGNFETIQIQLTEDEYNQIVLAPGFAALFHHVVPVPAVAPPAVVPNAPVLPNAIIPNGGNVPALPAVVEEAPNEPYEPDMPASRRRKTRRRRVSSNKRKAASRRRRSFRV